ncbi:MAG: CD1247 N-terminal domain-containing protein [Bacteroidota bacterium]
MEELREKAAYMRGVLEGINFNGDEKQKRLWESLIDFCDGVADDLGQLEDSHDEFADYIEAIDEDLCTLEKYFYNNEEEDEDSREVTFTSDQEHGVMEMNCPFCNQGLYFEDDEGEYEVVCPECGKVIWNSVDKEITPVNRKDDII